MAEPVDTTGAVTSPEADNDPTAAATQDGTADQNRTDASDEPMPRRSPRRRPLRHLTSKRVGIGLGTLAVIAMAAAAGWQGLNVQREHRASVQRDLLVETARQAAVNLTSINSAEIANDISRILDGSTGNFHDEFQQRSKAFSDVVTQAQSKSEGTVTAAGIESQSGDSAQVLVAVNVQTTVKGSTQPDPRAWRMRITVVGAATNPKVSDVQFVP